MAAIPISGRSETPAKMLLAYRLHRCLHSFWGEYSVQPPILENDRFGFGYRQQASVRKFSARLNTECNCQQDGQMTQQEILRRLVGDTSAGRFVGCVL